MQTNVKSTIAAALAADGNSGTSLYVRIPFNASNLSSLTALTLKMQYDDGYVAYLNGVQIASENAPAAPTWNSLANEEQTSGVQATTYENVDVSSFLNSATTGHLSASGNVLAIQVLMYAPSATEMLVVPELAQMTSAVGGDYIFSTPSPAAANVLADVQPDIAFSAADGFYDAPHPGDAHAQYLGHADLLYDRQYDAWYAGGQQHYLQRHDGHGDHAGRGGLRYR